MRVRLLWEATRCLWSRGAPVQARRSLSCGSRPLEELFACGGPLRTFLERHAKSEVHLQARGPELAVVAKRLREKEQELRETEHLLHGTGRTQAADAEEICLLFPLSRCPGVHSLPEFEALGSDENEDLRKLAENEITLCQKEITQLKHQIILLLVPSEETDENDLILEVTAGVGGQEAMLFTLEMFEMYQQYAAFKRWHFEPLEYLPSEIGGLRRASASIGGTEAYKHMKFEGGVHRVQRVPKTERQGRIHTSTMTVAILPQPTEISLVINPKDLRIDTKRATGAGGQHVNTTDSAVRIVHLPTGRRKRMRRKRSVP
nr:peptide chain release factor 1-like, mitochondrial isoform X5 [Loxodonta africana]